MGFIAHKMPSNAATERAFEKQPERPTAEKEARGGLQCLSIVHAQMPVIEDTSVYLLTLEYAYRRFFSFNGNVMFNP
ncbi:MAG: hypothetical protein K5657_08775 [Desulfovibrio sp.]|nr:hypothetical protein [Desulfovibrio sp.]